MSPCFCFIRVRNLAASFPNSSAWPSQGIIPLSRGGSFLRLQKTTCLIRNCLRCILKKKESLILFESIVRQTRELVCQDSPCASRVQKQNNESQQEKRSPHHDECAWSSALLPRVKYSAETNTNIRHITSHYEMHNFRSGGRVNVWIWLNLTMTSTVCHESFSGNNTTVRHDD